MNGFCILLYTFQILSAQLCWADTSVAYTQPTTSETNTSLTSDGPPTTVKVSPSTAVTSSSPARSTTIATTTTSSTSTSTTTTANNSPLSFLFQSGCFRCLIVTAGLILACTILLISTLMLACKVCQLNRHLKRMNSNIDLISTSEYKIGPTKKDKDKCEPEVNETSMLMADVSQTREDVGNGITKEDGGQVNEDEQAGEENKTEVGGATSNEESSMGENKNEAPVTTAENPSTSQPQEDIPNSQSISVAASSLGVAEEPKDVM